MGNFPFHAHGVCAGRSGLVNSTGLAALLENIRKGIIIMKKDRARKFKLVPIVDRARHESRIDSIRSHPTSHKPRPGLSLVVPLDHPTSDCGD
jgi:hypothetical protein